MNLLETARARLFGAVQDKPETPSEQTNDELKLVAFVRERVEEVRSSPSRVANEGIWMTNVAYLLGYDNVYYDTKLRTYLSTDRKPIRRNRIHTNKILPTVQNRLARLCKNPPRYDIRPESNDQEDKDAARLGIEVLGQIWDKQKLNDKRIDLTMMIQQFSHAYFHVCWDEELGNDMFDPVTGEFIGKEGDVRVDPVSPFEVFPDPMAKSMDDLGWLVRAKVRKLDYFRDRFDRGYLVKEEGAWLLSIQNELKLNSMNRINGSADNSNAQMKNSAIELTYYEKPSKKHRKGRMVVIANGVLLEDKELPVGCIPYVKFDDVVIGGRFTPEAIITHLRPHQDYKNALLRKREQWVTRMLAGKYLAARGSGLKQEALNSESGEVVEFDAVPGAPTPSPMPTPSIPSYVYQEDEQIDREIYDISGINEISRGTIPSAGLPAAGMMVLQEADDTRIGIVTERNEHAYALLGQIILKYVGYGYKLPRMLKSAGEGLNWSVRKFTGEMLRNNYDVICIRGSTIPGSKVLKRQEILNAYHEGLLGDPTDPKVREKLLDMLEYGDVAEIYEDHAIDMAQIKEQLLMLEQDQEMPKNEMDNHVLHFEIKNRFRKTDKFKTLSPMAQQMLIEDLNYHVNEIVKLTSPEVLQNEEMAQETLNATQQLSTDQLEENQGLQSLAGLEPQAQVDAMAPQPAA